MICFSSSVMVVNRDAKSRNLMSNSSVIEGYKSRTSNIMKELLGLLWTLLYQRSTSSVFFHWFRLVDAIICSLILASICLLTLPISDLQGFMRRQDGLLIKFGLWSFNVINDCFSAVILILSSSSRLDAMV